MVLSDSANSNWELTIDIFNKLIAPYIEAEDTSCQSAIFCDGFKGRGKKEVKNICSISIQNICSISIPQKNPYKGWRNHTKGPTIGQTNQQNLKRFRL